MEIKDCSNLTALLIGFAFVILCVLIYYLAQIYFKGISDQTKKGRGNGKTGR